MPKRTSKTGSELFIVDNSDDDWKVQRYLHDWCGLSKAIDVATGYFEIGGLLGLKDEAGLAAHPKCGASWEGYVIEEILDASRPDEACFWATHNGAEIDLVLRFGSGLYGVECRRNTRPIWSVWNKTPRPRL